MSKDMDREAQLRAGRAWNKMYDVETGSSLQKEDPTGENGWFMLTHQADQKASWTSWNENSPSYEEIEAQLIEDVLLYEEASDG